MIELREVVRKSKLREKIAPVHFHEESALVLKDLVIDQQDIGYCEGSRGHLHQRSLSRQVLGTSGESISIGRWYSNGFVPCSEIQSTIDCKPSRSEVWVR